MRCLVTGASGYIGSRLVPALLAAGHTVRCISRDPAKLTTAPWAEQVELVRADVQSSSDWATALEGMDAVCYLVHSMGSSDFAARDRRAATLLAEAAPLAGVRRIVYLGGLLPTSGRGSRHLDSRAEVGRILLEGAVPTVVLRAGVILGSGSLSFEMLRYLTEHLPVMVTPVWVRNRVQPIAIGDVVHHLVAALESPADVHRAFDIGGPEILTYAELMHRYAAVAGLRRRWILRVPVLTPWLSAQWINLVTPVPKRSAVPLVESLVCEVVRGEHDIEHVLGPPSGGPTGLDAAIRVALPRGGDADATTATMTELTERPGRSAPTDPVWSGGWSYSDRRARRTGVAPETLRRAVCHRAGVDPGSAQHTGSAQHSGDPVVLRATAPLPGRCWWEWRVVPDRRDRTGVLCQRVVFLPRGLAGHLTWWLSWPWRQVRFGRVLDRIIEAAQQECARQESAQGNPRSANGRR